MRFFHTKGDVMGLFDALAGAVMGGGENGSLINVVGSMLANDGEQGGLGGLMDKFNQAGLGEVIGSWVGKGENLPITQEQIASVLGSDALSSMAQKMGIDPNQAAGQLASMLPGLVDKLTPDGQAPVGGLGNAGDLLGMLGGLLKR
jgi:uncharacterized protein YidB (DUF937 family)